MCRVMGLLKLVLRGNIYLDMSNSEMNSTRSWVRLNLLNRIFTDTYITLYNDGALILRF